MNRSELQLRIDELADEFLQRRNDGENPTIEEFSKANPEIATPLRQYLRMILMVDDIRDESEFKTNPSFNVKSHPDSFPKLDDYEVIREIGRGGMGIVYEAHQLSLDRTVALKVLPSGLFQNQGAVKRFQLEAKSAARLHHTNIVPIFDVDQKDDLCYYAMQYIEGQSLDFVVNELGVMVGSREGDSSTGVSEASNPSDAKDAALSDTMTLGMSSTLAGRKPFYQNVARLGKQAADALHHAHENGIVHRDIKPANLMLDFNGNIWVTDFGLAKTDDSNLTQTGDVVGTLRYMSPERFAGKCDRGSDIYALGMTLYELLTQRPAFGNSDRLSLIDSIKTSSPQKLRKIDKNIPRDLETIVEKAIEKEPDRRYASAGEMATDLQRFMAGQPIQARRVSSVERLWLWGKKHKALAASLATSLFMLITGAITAVVAAFYYRDLADQNFLLAKSNEDKTAEVTNALQETKVYGERSAESLNLLTSAFASASPNQNADARSDMSAKDLLVYALDELSDSSLDNEGQEAFLGTLATSFEVLGEYDLALDANQQRLVKLEQIYGTREPAFPDGVATTENVPEVDKFLSVKQKLAECYGLKGDFETCERIYRENYEFTLEHCAADDQRAVDAMGYLANAYIKKEEFETARPLLEKAIAAKQVNSDRDRKQMEILKNNLGTCLTTAGEFESAVKLFEELIVQRTGKASVWETKSNLSSCYYDMGEFDKATELLNEIIDEYKDVFGEDHPSRLNAMNKLGACHWKFGETDLSVPLYEDVVRMYETKLGREHPDTQLAVANLAVNYLFDGQAKKAVTLFDEGYAETDPAFSGYIVVAYFLADEEEKFDRLVEKDYSEPAVLAKHFANLMRSFSNRNKLESAMRMVKKELEIREQIPEDWYLHLAHSFQSEVYTAMGEFEKASEILEQSIKELEKRLDELPEGFHHWVIALPAHKLRDALVADGTRPEAIKKWKAEVQRLDVKYLPNED